MKYQKSNEENYFYRLYDLEFSQDYLLDFIKNKVPKTNWYVFDCGKIRWTTQESYKTIRTECTSFERTEWFQELYNLFKIPVNFGDIIFTRTPPPGIPPHIDRNRPVALNFPVTGVFKSSPILWYENFDKQSETVRFYHSEISPVTKKLTALLFNPEKIHGVINKDDNDRCLFSIWWRNISYNDFLSRWKDGSIINWEALKSNKYIKIKRKMKDYD